MLLLIASPAYAKYQPPHSMPGPAADRILFKGGITLDLAPSSIDNGDVDLYLSSLKTTAAQQLLSKSSVRVIQVPAGSVSIILNPAPAPSGQLNPFAIRNVRFAIQYVINRDLVVNEIYKGLAARMVTHVSPFDYDYLGVSDIVKEANIRYDPDFAKKIVTDELTRAGASLKDGQWNFNGGPIHLKFIVRVEDDRKDIGDLVTAELRKLGFVVDSVYQNFGPAIASVYGTDPSVFEWNLYTEGWGRGTSERYDASSINQFCAPWLGNMPGWKEVGFWQYENSTIDQIGQRIFKGNFSDASERNQLYREATTMCLQESVRIWVVTLLSSFPIATSVQGLTLDSVGGPNSLSTLREAYVSGRSDLKVGNVWVWTERTIWNPVGGFADVYSIDIWRNLFDPPTWRNPLTGLPSPFRVAYTVQTSGPSGKILVPPDSVRWNAQSQTWESVGQGEFSISKVTFNYKNYFSSKWHDGQPITIADLFYSIYQTFDLAYNPAKSKVEFAISTVDRPYLDTFKGFRIINDTSIDVFVNYWHFVPSYIAEYASVTSLSMPWEVLAAMDSLVFDQRQLAYSETAAAKYQVDALSLVEENHARLVKTTISNFAIKQSFPQTVLKVGDRMLASVSDAESRYRAAISWFNQTGNMVISNGPFYLKAFNPPSQFAEIDAFRDSAYPFRPGGWYFGEPPSIEVLGIQGDFITIGRDSKFTVTVKGPSQLSLNYILFDPAKGTTIQKGEAQPVKNDTFSITLPGSLTSSLGAGNYELSVIASSDAISVVTERAKLLEASTNPSGSSTVIATTSSTPSVTSGIDPALLAGAVIAAVVVIAVTLFAMRRRGKGASG